MTARRSPMAFEVVPAGPVRGTVRAPASKSVTNRALVAAALATGVSTLCDPLDSDDSAAMRDCLGRLGAQIDVTPERWEVVGAGGTPGPPSGPLDARLSGTTARFVTAICALGAHGGEVTGLAPLRRRPIGPLVDALRSLGAKADDTDGGLPVHVAGGGLDGGVVEISVAGSSQFASALLLVAPYARADVVCRLRGRSATGYIALTIDLMRAWGAVVDDLADGWRVHAGAGYTSRRFDVEYDASAAAHLFALAAASGGRVTVSNATPTRQPDAGAVDVLAAFGCEVGHGRDGVTVAATGGLRPVDVSLATMPDQVTAFAALAALAPGVSVLRDVGVARLHETDRLQALTDELGGLGVRVEQTPDTLTVHGGTCHGPAVLRTHDDHRLAMAFAAIGTAVAGVRIVDPGCVAKTYPAFWDDARALGCVVRPPAPEVT